MRSRALALPTAAIPLSSIPKGTPLVQAYVELEVVLSHDSESNLYAGLEGWPGGVFLATYEQTPPLGARVMITVALPGDVTFRSKARVLFHRAAGESTWPGVGLHFEQLSPEQWAAIKSYARQRVPLMHEP